MSCERFKCSAKECKAVFTVTSGTAFAWRKVLQEDAAGDLVRGQLRQGKAALQLSRELGVQYKMREFS
ncbi:hypothetical protein [Microvirga roseola]|uniref:hypothetical protein n=1 Tax=Microvirga roseola TaxID=2883126 RepID=UPI001E405D32|nr:hypothetical protein [Microvirga roseola]